MAITRGKPDQIDKKNTNSDNFSKTIEVQKETQAGIDNLRQSTIDSSISTADTKSDLTVEKTGLKYEKDIRSLVGFLSVVDNLLEEIEDTKKGISKRGLSKAGKKTMSEVKIKLKQYEKQLKGKRKTLLKQNKAGRTEIYENDIVNLRNLWQQVDQVRKDIGMGQWGEFSNTAPYLYNSPETARKSNKHQTKDLKFNQKFQEDLKEGAILNIFNGDVQRANNFLRRISQGKYTTADYQIYVTNSTILNPYFQRYQIAVPTSPIGTAGGTERTSRTVRKSIDYSNMDWGDTFKQGGVAGLLDKVLTNCSNMTPGQKNTWKTLGVLGIIGGVIYGQYKFYTSKNIGLGTKIGLTILPIFGSQLLTGKDPITLFNELLTGGISGSELKSKFGNAVGGLSSSGSEAAEIVVPALQSEMIFNSGATVGSVQQMTQAFRTDKRNRINFYQQSCDKIQKEYGNSATESFRTTFSENFDEEKWKNWLASLGITGSTENKKTVHELADNAYNNKVIFEKFLSDNNLKITTDPTKKAELNAYIQGKNEKNESVKIDDFRSNTEWFMPNNPQSNHNTQVPSHGKNNPQTAEQQNDQSIEITNNSLKTSVEKGLFELFKHFRSKYGSKIKYIKISEKNIPMYSLGITSDILSKTIKNHGNLITIDLSDYNIKAIYDNAVEKLAQSQDGLLNAFGTLSKEIREYKRDKIKSFRERGQTNKYNERKNNLTDAIKILFESIVKDLESQQNVRITRNGQEFNNINDAITSVQIFN